MEYIKSNNRKKYGREYVSIMIKKKKIINNPGMKLDDEYQKFRTATLAVIFVFLIFLVITKASSNIICAFLSGMIFFELVIGCIRLIGMKKAMKPLQNKKEPHFDFDEEGLIISRVEEKLKVKVYWENYQCIRVYKYSIAFCRIVKTEQ